MEINPDIVAQVRGFLSTWKGPEDPFAGINDVEFDVPEPMEVAASEVSAYLGVYNWMHPKVLSRGNMKIAKNTMIFNLPPVLTCPVNASCRATCYAVPAYRQYPGVRWKYDSNWMLATKEPEYLQAQIVAQLQAERGVEIVRLHSSGDFFSQGYVDMWTGITEAFPKIKFYTYTKADKVLNFEALESLKNFNLIRSLIDGKLNYGSMEYLERMKKRYPKSFICPATAGKNVHCGKECRYCVEGNMPLFKIHGTQRMAGKLPKSMFTE